MEKSEEYLLFHIKHEYVKLENFDDDFADNYCRIYLIINNYLNFFDFILILMLHKCVEGVDI